MVNPSSRDYLVRIWGKTRSRGKVRSGPALTELCREIFEGVVACVGYLASSHGWLGDEFLFLSHPCDRQVSREGRRDRIQPKMLQFAQRGFALEINEILMSRPLRFR